jgi:hypothetical protein
MREETHIVVLIDSARSDAEQWSDGRYSLQWGDQIFKHQSEIDEDMKLDQVHDSFQSKVLRFQKLLLQ